MKKIDYYSHLKHFINKARKHSKNFDWLIPVEEVKFPIGEIPSDAINLETAYRKYIIRKINGTEHGDDWDAVNQHFRTSLMNEIRSLSSLMLVAATRMGTAAHILRNTNNLHFEESDLRQSYESLANAETLCHFYLFDQWLNPHHYPADPLLNPNVFISVTDTRESLETLVDELEGGFEGRETRECEQREVLQALKSQGARKNREDFVRYLHESLQADKDRSREARDALKDREALEDRAREHREARKAREDREARASSPDEQNEIEPRQE